MKKPNKDPVHIGLHIHKCAGTSLQIHFARCDNNGATFWHTNPIVNYQQSKLEIEERNLISRNMVKVIWGHQVQDFFVSLFSNRPIFLFTFLREPVSRMISWYNYDSRRFLELNGTLEGFQSFDSYISERQNQMCHFILSRFPNLVDDSTKPLHEQAISVLEKFSFVGLQEDFQVGVNNLLKVIKVRPFPERLKKNVSKKKAQFDHSEVELKKLNESDILLYKYALTRYSQSNQPDLNRIFYAKDEDLATNLEASAEFANFINRRVIPMTEDITMNKCLAEYKEDNLRKLTFLLIRQVAAETVPYKKTVYQKLLCDLASELEVGIERQDILNI